MALLVKSKRFNYTPWQSYKSRIGVGEGNSPASPDSPASLTSSSGSNNPDSIPTTPQAGTRNSELTNPLVPRNTSESTTATPVTSEAKIGTPVTLEAASYLTPEPPTRSPERQRPAPGAQFPPNEVPSQSQEIPWTPEEGGDPEEFEKLAKMFGYYGPTSDS